jgi:serine/threonine-protein kinase
MLSALHDAHAKGIIHRDMKPENVFLAFDARMREEVKLLDFGVAKFKQRSGHEQRLELTQTGMTLGTPYYLSPEQARGRKNIDERIDLWSVGVMLYEMLTGCRPFEGEGYNEILSSVLLDEPRPVGEVAPEVPERLAAVVDRALQKDRDWRYQSAGEMIGDLLLFYDRDASEGLTSSVVQALFSCRDQGESFAVATRPSSEPPSGKNGRGADAWLLNSDIPEVVTPRRSARWLGLGGMIGALVLGVVVAAVLLGRPAEEQRPPFVPPAAAPAVNAPAAARTEPAPTSVHLEIVGLPADARIRLDGRPVSASIERPRSSHPLILKITAAGYAPFEKAVVFERDQRLEPALELLPAAPEPEPERSRPKRKRRAKRKSVLAENPFGN